MTVSTVSKKTFFRSEDALWLHKKTYDLFNLYFIVCDYKGRKIPIGMTKPAGDNCNTCTCRPNGRLECTEKICCMYCFECDSFIF